MAITQINLDTGATSALTHDAPRPSATDSIVWLDVSAPSEDDLQWLARAYNFHPLAIEDCRHFEQRAKVDTYDDYLFISIDQVTRANGDLTAQELETFLGSDFLITVHREPIAALDTMRGRCAKDNRTGNFRADFLFYQIADRIVDDLFPLLDLIEDEIDDLEDTILAKPTQATLHRVFELKRQLVFLRKIIGPFRDAMDVLADMRYAMISAQTALYFRDIYDHLVRIYDLIETARDLLSNALDAYLSTVSNRMNDVMKRLTLFATIFLPISFVVGFGGMNFTNLPFDDPRALTLMLVLIVAFPTTMLLYYWRKGWL
ncbi:MAG: magnesium/cobalt transporter CorA [Chloroflexi bacterium]|nr:magnesium/cobalt transporter CorA [Chloroflexota bacterium]